MKIFLGLLLILLVVSSFSCAGTQVMDTNTILILESTGLGCAIDNQGRVIETPGFT